MHPSARRQSSRINASRHRKSKIENRISKRMGKIFRSDPSSSFLIIIILYSKGIILYISDVVSVSSLCYFTMRTIPPHHQRSAGSSSSSSSSKNTSMMWLSISSGCLFLFSSWCLLSTPVAAFSPIAIATATTTTCTSGTGRIRPSLLPLHNDINPSLDGGGGGNGSSFDVDSARKQLQSMFTNDENKNCDNGSSNSNGKNNQENRKFDLRTFLAQAVQEETKWKQPPPPPTGKPVPLEDSLLPPLPTLSTIERDRREAEIQILERLTSNDEYMKQLWDLWYSERGGRALARLQQADQLMGDPTSWQDCETSLLQIIDEYSIYFVEPVNRLATLYYLQGKYDESYHLCRLILLHLKPWHVGALAGMVQVCINRGDRDQARYWATKRLPSSVAGSSFPPFDATNGPENPRRGEWVQEMVEVAQQMLQKAEQNTKKSFGKPEEYYKKRKEQPKQEEEESLLEEGDDAWQ